MSEDEIEVTQASPEGETVQTETAPEQAPETVTEQTPEGQEEEAPKPKHKPWFQERIDQLTREKYDNQRRAEAAEARLTEALANPDAAPAKTPDVDKLVEEALRTREFNAKCDEIYTSGASEFEDFDEVLGNFKMLGGLTPTLLEAVTQLPDAHKVLHSLGQNMDEAARILALPPVPMAVALAKLSQSAPKPKPVSKAPPPIKPIDGMPTGEKSPDDMDMDEWIKWREGELKKQA